MKAAVIEHQIAARVVNSYPDRQKVTGHLRIV